MLHPIGALAGHVLVFVQVRVMWLVITFICVICIEVIKVRCPYCRLVSSSKISSHSP
jgi:hypothetical protein